LALLYEDRERVDLGVYVYFKSLIDFTEAELLSFCIFSFIFILGFYFLVFVWWFPYLVCRRCVCSRQL